jgi:lysozyme inhibitor LprI
MSKLKFSLMASLLVSFTYPSFCQAVISDPATKQICAEVKEVELPAQDRPSPEEAKALADCVSEDLYFGFGRPADPVRARQCAYLEMEKGEKNLPFGGRAILMMVYANGKGAARNFDAAIKLGCEINGAPNDVAGNVRQLARFKQGHWSGDNFSVCDHSSGRYMYLKCAILQDRFDKAERDKRLNAIVSRWNAQNQRAFQPLHQAAEGFFSAHASQEADLEATIEVHEKAFLEKRFISMLEQCERGELPKFTAEQFSQADGSMSIEYSKIQTGNVQRWGSVTIEGIRTAQQAWISYRDAWVTFGKQKYPAVSNESWKTWLTTQRVEMLDFFLH